MTATKALADWRDRWSAGWRSPGSLTALVPSAAEDHQHLRNTLEKREPSILEALRSVEDLHALRLVVIPPSEGRPTRLLVNSVCDSPPAIHRAKVAAALHPFVAELVAGAPDSPEALGSLLSKHHNREKTLFLASPGVTLARIREEARLREVLRDWLEARREDGSLGTMRLDEAHAAARDHVRGLADPTCAREPIPPVPGRWRRRLECAATFLFFPLFGVLGKDIHLAAEAQRTPAARLGTHAALALWWIYAAPFTALALLFVRLREWLEPEVVPAPASEAKLLHVESVEDAQTKNELTVWFPVKPDPIGRFLMWLTLFGSERGTRHLWTRGSLAGAENIHYARLLLADGGRRMIFMSDYEGSFDAYIDHFIGIGGKTRAVIPISSRVLGCPPTRWLYWPVEGVSFPRRWREMARSYQLQASVRYVAYPDLSANDILNHSVIRERLFAESLSPEELKDWAARI